MKHCDILILDDDLDDVEMLKEVLNKDGIEKVHYVHTAIEAIQYLKELDSECIPKVIVTDLKLPGVTGVEFLTYFKTLNQFKNVSVVILSSSKNKHQTELLKDLGHLDFFEKPLSLNGYFQIVEKIKSKL